MSPLPSVIFSQNEASVADQFKLFQKHRLENDKVRRTYHSKIELKRYIWQKNEHNLVLSKIQKLWLIDILIPNDINKS